MRNKSNITKKLSLTIGLVALFLTSGVLSEGFAQSSRDPFATPAYKRQTVSRPTSTAPTTSTPKPSSNNSSPNVAAVKKPTGPVVVAAPSIQDRIDYYKRIREQAALNGQDIPKVTSVLLLEEMTISGIFKTPRGYAAMVEAKPINLSYTIYPGEKFFDGQLVAVEENRLVFRKVSKLTNGKFISSVENKALRQYTIQQEIQGTAPTESAPTESARNTVPGVEVKNDIISPLDEMNSQPAENAEESAKDKSEKGKKGKKRPSKKKTRIAKKN